MIRITLLFFILIQSILFSASYDLKTQKSASWHVVNTNLGPIYQVRPEIKIGEHKLSVIYEKQQLKLKFEPLFYYKEQMKKYGKVKNYYYKTQYSVNVDNKSFSGLKNCSKGGDWCDKNGKSFTMVINEEEIQQLKKGNKIFFDTSTFTDDITFTFTLKGFTTAFNKSFTQDKKDIFDLPFRVINNDIPAVRKILLKGTNPNYKFDGKTSLIAIAVKKENKEMIRLLVLSGADIDAKNAQGDTSLTSLAHFSENIQLMKFLIKMGANPNISDVDGRNSLARTVNYDDNFGKMRLLLNAGVDINGVRNDGKSVLQGAIYHSWRSGIKNVKFLVNHGAKINTTDDEGNTPLMEAIIKRDSTTAIYLLKKGAKTYQRNNEGENARSLALNISHYYKAKYDSENQSKKEKTRIVRSNFKYIVALIDE